MYSQVKGADDIAKPYTPVTPSDQKGWFRLIVKCYPGGSVSAYLHTLTPGDSIQVKGPFTKLQYKANSHKHIGMIAGGTGITPMLQIIKEIVRNPSDKTNVHLIFQNRSEKDLSVIQAEIDDIVSNFSNIHVTYILSQPSEKWDGFRGHLGAALIEQTIPKPAKGADEPLVYVCGPQSMVDSVCGPKAEDKSQGPLQGLLKAAGYSGELKFYL